jgi:hypothetical protein
MWAKVPPRRSAEMAPERPAPYNASGPDIGAEAARHDEASALIAFDP